jgi:hypothetical protein
MANDNIVKLWNELKVIFDSIENDIQKNAAGNASAGVRSRRGLRFLKKRLTNLIKETIEVEKARREAE